VPSGFSTVPVSREKKLGRGVFLWWHLNVEQLLAALTPPGHDPACVLVDDPRSEWHGRLAGRAQEVLRFDVHDRLYPALQATPRPSHRIGVRE
jgi:hypothetical protein